ncbi:MAG: hypothetical protein CL887_00555 [Dehalococcoidia bacterium]|nr:hypothetical protein [Dehalococcoidia bacterium]|tara:strand:+ start:188 stop:892 length:705 start_codon:yes stop_codon:yes gene_type:complete
MDNSSDLFHLQSLDTDIDVATRRLADIRIILNDKSELEKSSKILKAVEHGHKKAMKLHKDTENETQRLEDRKSEITQKIYSGTINNPRELSAFEDEIRNLTSQIDNTEENLLIQMEELDKYENGLKKATSNYEREMEQYGKLTEELQSEINELSSVIDKNTPLRNMTRELLSSETLRIYDNLKESRDGIAVSSVESNRCSTCRISVPTQMIQKLKSGSEFVYCNSCRRILLMRP